MSVRIVAPWLALLSALTGVSGLGCSQAPAAPANVVLVVLDTVRADHLSSYGYPVATTPRIDAVAARADRYASARATAPWTLPSHASMFTGLDPFEHGAHARIVDGRVRELPLAEGHWTLAEALQSAGYRTGAIVANRLFLGARHGFGQGFEVYHEKPGRRGNRAGRPDVSALALEFVDQRPDDSPFFLFLNYMEAHRPYHVGPLPEARAADLPPPDQAPAHTLLDELAIAVLEREEPASAALIGRVVSQYDVALAHLDLAVGELVSGLQARGLWDDTLFILTSDHGEYFGEHDLVEHSKDVYEEALAVPLIVKRPGQQAGRVVVERFSLTGLPRLVGEQIGGEVGRSVRDAFPALDEKLVFAELRYTRPKNLYKPYGSRFARIRTVVYRGPYKAIWSSDGRHELYDVAEDPAETENLVERRTDVAGELLDLAQAAQERGEALEPATAAMEFSAEDQQQLRELGYVE